MDPERFMSQAPKFPGPHVCSSLPLLIFISCQPGRGVGTSEGPSSWQHGSARKEGAGLPQMPFQAPGHFIDEKTETREGSDMFTQHHLALGFLAWCSSN